MDQIPQPKTCAARTTNVTQRGQMRTPHSCEGSEHIFEYRATAGILQDVSLRRFVTEIRNFHGG
jgi:hypothetical protein